MLFLPTDLQIENIFALLAICLDANFFFYSAKFCFLHIWPIFFFNSTYMQVFNFRQIFKRKLYIRLTIELSYIWEYTLYTFISPFILRHLLKLRQNTEIKNRHKWTNMMNEIIISDISFTRKIAIYWDNAMRILWLCFYFPLYTLKTKPHFSELFLLKYSFLFINI